MKHLSIIAALALLAGCSNEALETQYSANGAKADKIAVIESCNLYRINDGTLVYAVICPDGRASATRDVHCGKGCVRKFATPTVIKPETPTHD